jgi:hypothetical protein
MSNAVQYIIANTYYSAATAVLYEFTQMRDVKQQGIITQ